MYAGKVVEEAPVEGLFGNPRRPYARAHPLDPQVDQRRRRSSGWRRSRHGASLLGAAGLPFRRPLQV
jgi:ABC-type dipeptide/oligopeptide/nickel transport system ATPase component